MRCVMGGIGINPQDYVVTSDLYLRLLGLVYLIACVSLGVQVAGLIGKSGILPAERFLEAVLESLGRGAYVYLPSLAWLNASDLALRMLCLIGALGGALLLLGLQCTPLLALCWAVYLSLVSVGQAFLGYQWDALLVEAGFLAIFLARPSLLPAAPIAPAALVVFLHRWLLFRLMFMSGLAKLTSGDPTWRNLTALSYHYETQPLPNPLAWYAHRAPLPFEKFSTLATLFIELIVPFSFFLPPPIRVAGGALTVLLQLLIMATGNFAFFNILSIFLCVMLLDDRILIGAVPGLAPLSRGAAASGWPLWVLAPLTALYVLVGLLYVVRPLTREASIRRTARPVLEVVEAFRLVNPYGLFASMTTRRQEIVMEGSDDGETWLAYEFKYKPGDPRRAPPVVAPHQPRLDWQMWFAALGAYATNPWFVAFAVRLLIGAPEVLRLLARNPFAEQPPRYVRAALYDYHFTTSQERAESGAWWRRKRVGLYMPVVGLEEDGSKT